ncbi:MAG: dienelactone hydrolase family protein [Bacteroidetes bacterium SW_11_64_17]|nr:MAG: dienelactone hydrolase family protein [Bacteroidetes bacterium SW_11_64_17]
MSLRPALLVLFAMALLAGCGSDGESEADRMAEEHEEETPTASAGARAPDIPVTADTVTYTRTDEGTPVEGYVAAPSTLDSVLNAHGMDPSSARLPGVVVIHEWWGLNDNVRTATRRLAGQGYRALAVDVYEGAVANSADSARALMKRAMGQQEQVMANLQDAHDHLRSDAEAPRVAVMGWCFGGGRTFDAVAATPTQYDAAVAYYGAPESMTTEVLDETTTPLLAHFGREDQAVSPESAKEFQSRVEEASAEGAIHFYDAGHAFANPSGDSYEPEAAEQAWSRTTDFLERHLYP